MLLLAMVLVFHIYMDVQIKLISLIAQQIQMMETCIDIVYGVQIHML